MIIWVPEHATPPPIYRYEERDILRSLERTVGEISRKNESPQELTRYLNYAIKAIFEKGYDLEIEYAGPYGILPENPLFSNPIFPDEAVYRKPGCKNIPLGVGVIGHGIMHHDSMYVKAVLGVEAINKAAHWDCRDKEASSDSASTTPKREMSEFFIVNRKNYTLPNGKEIELVQEGYDLDIIRPGVFSEEGARELDRVIKPALIKIFPGPITYQPTKGIHYQENGRTECPI